ncbi:MAG: hypothetical protein AB7S70_13730 [Hyphomicrobium sp.]|uniref:hypothetical protein n=1 Tax=Hyphomicrobium sp. TaxID=82 RepID=UPI003D1255D5
MGDLVSIDLVRDEKAEAERERMVSTLESLLARAKAGELIGVCFAAIPNDRQSITVGALKLDACGAHELVGVSALLADYIADAVRS